MHLNRSQSLPHMKAIISKWLLAGFHGGNCCHWLTDGYTASFRAHGICHPPGLLWYTIAEDWVCKGFICFITYFASLTILKENCTEKTWNSKTQNTTFRSVAFRLCIYDLNAAHSHTLWCIMRTKTSKTSMEKLSCPVLPHPRPSYNHDSL